MAKNVDIAAMLGKQFADVPKSDTSGRDQIRYIALELLDADPNNFYKLDGVEELAANIELCGLQQPLRVRSGDGGRYTIVSGHRRRAALELLRSEDPEKWREAPCIVEQADGVSPALQELRLIYANADTRVLTSAEISKQAERVEDLLYQLKKEGMEFPGRMRDHVAKACKISKSKLARLKVIRDKLIPLWAKKYEAGKLAEDTAYELAKLPDVHQRKLYDAKEEKGIYLTGDSVAQKWGRELAALDEIKCPQGEQCCTNADNMWARMLKQDYCCKNCDGTYGRTAKCCKGCPELLKCKFACPAFEDKIAKGKAKQKEARKAEKSVEQAKKDALLSAARKSWARFREARTRTKMSTKYVLKMIAGDDPNKSYYKNDWYVDKIDGCQDPQNSTNTGQLADSLRQDDLVRMADLLDCSLDYLLGRADDPRPYTGAWTRVQDGKPDEGRFVFVCDAFGSVQPSVYWHGEFMDATPESVANKALRNIHLWMYQPALPDRYQHTGQNVLDELMKGRAEHDDAGV